MERMTIKMCNDEYICEFGTSGGIDSLWIWPRERSDLAMEHALNLPKYNKEGFFKEELSSNDGLTPKSMKQVAARYGFFNYQFINAYSEWKIKQEK
jgi:hypothetical protein